MIRAFMLLLIIAVAATAQFQPAPPDWSGLEQRTDLSEAGELAGAKRVLRFVQVSDAHIIDDDAPYPMRQEPLDQFGEPFTSAQRPQEEYTDEVLNAMIASINAAHAQDELDYVITTGDNIDNQLENELMRFIDNWQGTLTTKGPVSGFECVPDGQSTSVDDDSNDEADRCTHLPGELAANNTALAPGVPWFSALGNHDGLIQGNVPVQPSFDEAAAEFGRYFLRQNEYVSMHFADGACPSGAPGGGILDHYGHGYGFAGDRLCDEDPDNDGYYAFSARGVRFVVLDTVNDDFVTGNEELAGFFDPEGTVGYDLVGGYSQGSIDPVQWQWLMDEIEDNEDQLVVVISHHTVNSMFSNAAEGQCEGPNGECLHDLLTQAGYKTGPEITAALAARPNVVAWIGGHTHKHFIEPKTTAAGGFWNVETSSLIDMPQETRVIEVWVTANGTKGFFAMTRLGHSFTLSTELAQGDTQKEGGAGESKDQDVILWFDIPEGVELLPQPSLPRLLGPRLLEPVAVNGSHASVGDNVSVLLHVQDNLLQQPIDGVGLTVTVERVDAVEARGVTLVPTTQPQGLGGGNYSFTFEAQAPFVHYVRYTFSDPDGIYPDASRVAPLTISGELDEPVTKKKSPGVAVAVAIGGLGLIALRRR